LLTRLIAIPEDAKVIRISEISSSWARLLCLKKQKMIGQIDFFAITLHKSRLILADTSNEKLETIFFLRLSYNVKRYIIKFMIESYRDKGIQKK
jgi:hypothetical protein